MKSRLCDYWTPSPWKILLCELSPDPATKGLRRDPGLCTWCMENLPVDLHVDGCEKAEKWIFHIRLFTVLNEEIKEKIWGGWGNGDKKGVEVSSSCSLNYASADISSGTSQNCKGTFLICNISYNWEFIYMSQEKTAPLIGRQGWKISVWPY